MVMGLLQVHMYKLYVPILLLYCKILYEMAVTLLEERCREYNIIVNLGGPLP